MKKLSLLIVSITLLISTVGTSHYDYWPHWSGWSDNASDGLC